MRPSFDSWNLPNGHVTHVADQIEVGLAGGNTPDAHLVSTDLDADLAGIDDLHKLLTVAQAGVEPSSETPKR